MRVLTPSVRVSNEQLLEVVPRLATSDRDSKRGPRRAIEPSDPITSPVANWRKPDRLNYERSRICGRSAAFDLRTELSELELIHVCGGDDLGWPENHFTLATNRIFAKATRREFISLLAGDLAFG